MSPSRRGALGGVLAALLVAAAACGEDPFYPVWDVVEEVTFADEFVTADNDTIPFDLGQMTETSHTPVGVWYQDIEVAVGDTAVEGDSVFFSYTGWLRDGTSFGEGEGNFRFLVGDVIPGIHFGTQGQQVGGTRLLVIPPEWAYGSAGAGNGVIYPGAAILFAVRIDSIHAAP